MNDFAVEVERALPLDNALVLTAFPTIGNVASTVVRFLVDMKDLKRVGAIYSPRYPPLGAIHDGRVGPPVEIRVGECRCGMDDEWDKLVVVTSDAPVPNELAHDLAVTILEWARDVGSGELVALEGMKSRSADGTDVHGLASTEDARHRLVDHGIPLLNDGLIGGVTSVLLHRGTAKGVDVYGLLVRANAKQTDASAAVELLRAANRALIHGDFDEDALEASVAQVEGRLRERQEGIVRTGDGRRDVAYV